MNLLLAGRKIVKAGTIAYIGSRPDGPLAYLFYDLALFWWNDHGRTTKPIMLIFSHRFMNLLLAGRKIVKAGTIAYIGSRPDGPLAESTTTIGTHIVKHCCDAI